MQARIQLAGTVPTQVCDLADVDWLLPADPEEQVVLFSQSGSSAKPTDFAPNAPFNLSVSKTSLRWAALFLPQ